MIIQDQDKKHLYNSDKIAVIAITQDDDKWYISFIEDQYSNPAYMAVYSTEERAQYELDWLVDAFVRDAKVYLMPEEE